MARAVPTVLLVLGLAQVVPGIVAFVAPGAFYDALAAYPPENDHFLKDLGTWQIGLGLAAILAARRPAWQAPMLLVLAVQYGLHTVSHIIDVDAAEEDWQGVFALVYHALATALLVVLFAVRERARDA